MSRHPNSRSSQTSAGDENLSRAMKPHSAGANKGKPEGDMATAGAKGPAKQYAPVGKYAAGKVSNTKNMVKC